MRCSAIGCENTIDIKRKPAAQVELEKVMKITFHSFPSDPVRRAKWIRILKLEDKTITNRSRLCSLHFKERYIDRTSLVYVRLRENAIPHIFENMWDEMETHKTVSTPPEFLNAQIKVEDNREQSVIYLNCDKGTSTSLSLSFRPETRKPTQDKETRISPERIWHMNSSNMEAIRKARSSEIQQLRKRLQALKQQIRRKDEKIAIIKTILNKFTTENLTND